MGGDRPKFLELFVGSIGSGGVIICHHKRTPETISLVSGLGTAGVFQLHRNDQVRLRVDLQGGIDTWDASPENNPMSHGGLQFTQPRWNRQCLHRG